jgi:hypothetical protein
MEYCVVRFSTKLLKAHGCDYINDMRKLFFESIYSPSKGVILVIVENQTDDDGNAVRFDADCFLLMREFFESLLLSFTNIKNKDVSTIEKPISTAVEE